MPDPQITNQRRLGSEWLIGIFITVIHVVWTRICWGNIPLQTDTGMWAYIGGRILEGAVPYRDLWESKPPGIYYVFAAMEGLFGHYAVDALAWLDGAVSLAVLFMTYRVARYFTTPLAAVFTVNILVFVFCNRVLADWGNNVEKYVALFEMSAIWIMLSGRRRDSQSAWNWLAAGGIMALASMFKQSGIAMLAAATIHTLWSGRVLGNRLAASLKSVSLIAVGFLAAWVPVIIGLMAVGSWKAFVDQVLLYDVVRAAAPSGEGARLFSADHWRTVWESLHHGLILFGPALIMLFAVLRTGLLMNRQPVDSISPKAKFQKIGMTLAAMYAGLAMIPALLAPHGYGHYLLQAAPPCAVLMASLVALVISGKVSMATRLVCLLSFAVSYYPMKEHFLFTIKGDSESGAYAFQQNRIAQLVDAIDQSTAPNQLVMLWPPDYAVSYYAKRVTPLECSNSDVLFKGKSYRLSPPMDELLARLKSNPPEFIFDHTGVFVDDSEGGLRLRVQPAVSLIEAPDVNHPLPDGRLLAPFKQWLRENYGGQTRTGQATIYYRGKPWREWTDYLFEAIPGVNPQTRESP